MGSIEQEGEYRDIQCPLYILGSALCQPTFTFFWGRGGVIIVTSMVSHLESEKIF